MNIEPGFSRTSAGSEAAIDAHDQNLRVRRIFIGAAAALALIILVIVGLHFLRQEKPTVAAPPSVSVIVPGRQPVTRTISVTGTLAARREMPVGVAGEGGMIARVFVEPGDWVKAGQTLAVIDAAVQAQQAAQLEAQINAARADAALAESELSRALSLVGRGFISQADVERKRAARDSAIARVAVARAQLGETRARIGRLAIRAPAAGLVLTRSVEPGQVVGAGNGVLFRLARDGDMELKARLSEADLALLSVGDPVDVTPIGSTRSFAGKIWQLSPVIDPASRQGEARVQLGYEKALRPGGFAAATIKSGTAMVPLLPESAVQSDAKGNYVLIVGPDNKAVRRDIKVGSVNDSGLPILSGLIGDEQVVLSAGAFLSPGDTVTPVRADRSK